MTHVHIGGDVSVYVVGNGCVELTVRNGDDSATVYMNPELTRMVAAVLRATFDPCEEPA